MTGKTQRFRHCLLLAKTCRSCTSIWAGIECPDRPSYLYRADRAPYPLAVGVTPSRDLNNRASPPSRFLATSSPSNSAFAAHPSLSTPKTQLYCYQTSLSLLAVNMMANSARSNITDALPRSLSTLPPELLCDIFSYVITRHETGGYVVDAQCLASLTVVCRSLRAVAQDMLFREVYITNEHQLRTIAQCPPHLLQIVS